MSVHLGRWSLSGKGLPFLSHFREVFESHFRRKELAWRLKCRPGKLKKSSKDIYIYISLSTTEFDIGLNGSFKRNDSMACG